MKTNSEKTELEQLIKQILKPIEKIEETESHENEKIEDFLEEIDIDKIEADEKDFLENLDENEGTYNLFMKEVMPDSYKLRFGYGGEAFEGYYDSVIESVRKTKGTSFSSMGAEYEYETLQNSLVIIRCAKEFKSDALVLDSSKKACVEAAKAQSLTWWQVLYELESKVIFCTQNIGGPSF